MLSNKEKFIFTSELALAISNGLQIEEGLKCWLVLMRG